MFSSQEFSSCRSSDKCFVRRLETGGRSADDCSVVRSSVVAGVQTNALRELKKLEEIIASLHSAEELEDKCFANRAV